MAKVTDIKLPKDRKAAFEMMWRDELLGNYETISGAGSTLSLTHNLRKALQHLIDSQMVTSILDVGCGDWNWMSAMNLNGVRYLGIDIVSDCIERNIERHLQPNISFRQMDIVNEAPSARHDLILCRDLFTHMTVEETMRAVNNLKRAGGTYLAATNYYTGLAKPALWEYFAKHMNKDSASAYWRPVYMQDAPYYFPAPLISVMEKQGVRVLDIWKLDDISEMSLERSKKAASHGAFTAVDIRQLEFIRRLSSLPFIKRIGMYGSRMLGTYKPDSDIDIMLYCDDNTPTTQQWLEICDILDHADTPLEIDCKIFCPQVRSILDQPDVYQYHMDNMITLYARKD